MKVSREKTDLVNDLWCHSHGAFFTVCRMQEFWVVVGGVYPNFRRSGRPGSLPLRGQCVSLESEVEEQWRPREVGNARHMECLLRRTTGNVLRLPVRDHECSNRQFLGMGLPKVLEFIPYHILLQVLNVELQDLMFDLLGFGLALVCVFSIFLLLPFGR